MRGKLDLGEHKLAGLFRAPAERRRWKTARREKCPDATYRTIWNLVAGGVRDTFANHPEYLTPAGQQAAERSITKRVTGTIYGYATQVARGRSIGRADAPGDLAAEQIGRAATRADQPPSVLRAVAWVRASYVSLSRLCRAVGTKFWWWRWPR